ncbi:MAG: DUF4224 domain-containing protein [Shewanella sp.]
MFLTRAQLKDLTGYAQPARQATWLRKNYGLEVVLNARGDVAVTDTVLDSVIRGKKPDLQPRWKNSHAAPA